MIIAMSIVLMMQMAVYQVVNMVAMRNRFMATTRSMDVGGIMTAANMPARTISRIGFIHVQRMFLNDSSTALMMQMTIVQKVDVVTMLNGRVAALSSMNMGMIFVRMTHYFLLQRHRNR